jgi:uncharacterized iron-regulated membrane protein
MSRTDVKPASATGGRLYRAVWRWHFYAGLFVAPFFLILACTGLVMVYGNSIETFLGPKYTVASGGDRASLVDQAAAAQASVPGSTVSMMVQPADSSRATMFVAGDAEGRSHVVSVDPNGPSVVGSVIKDDTWFYWASDIHGTLLIGDVGDRLLEVAAGLGIVMILTGLYLWWPRGERRLLRSFVPNLASRGRTLWKELHGSLGYTISIVLVFFLVSGLAWTGVWGGQYVQAWSTFPAEKWDNVPLSDQTHAAMNHGAANEVPWALEQTPLPLSGSPAGVTGLPEGTPVNLDTIAALARTIGFEGQFRINLPLDETGVYTISADSMDGDTTNPTGDRTVHIDQYSGRILAEVGFADYSIAGKAMAVGIALHQANMGWWNTLLNVLFCLAVIAMVVTGLVMWWVRRPSGRVGVPLYPKSYRTPIAIIAIALAVSIAFPLTGIGIVLFAVIDFLLPKRWKEVGGQAGA